AMDRFGSDKPDLRFGMEIQDLSKEFTKSGFRVFDDALERGGIVRGIVASGCASYSRGQLDKLTDLAKRYGAKGLVWVKWEESGTVNSSVSKFFDEAKLKA